MESPKAKPGSSGIADTSPARVMGIAMLNSMMDSPITIHEPLPVYKSTADSIRLITAVSSAPKWSANTPPRAFPRQLMQGTRSIRYPVFSKPSGQMNPP